MRYFTLLGVVSALTLATGRKVGLSSKTTKGVVRKVKGCGGKTVVLNPEDQEIRTMFSSLEYGTLLKSPDHIFSWRSWIT